MNVRPTGMLAPEHAEHLARFRIPPEIIEAAGVRSVTDAEAREMLALNGQRGADLGGILIPYLSPVTGDRVGARIRLDHLLPDGGKYISEPGCRHLFFPPNVADLLSDMTVSVVLVESEKAALSLTAFAVRKGRKLLVIALGGCWGWRRTIGKRPLPDGDSEPEKGPSPDLDLITWEGRRVILAFDSNASTNAHVQTARRVLAKELSQRGAKVVVAEVPASEGVNGPDDLIAVSGDEAMLDVLDRATSGNREAITLRPGQRPVAVDLAEDILLAHSERLAIFQRAGELVRIISLPAFSKGGGLQRPKGTVQLEQLSSLALTEIFDRIVRWQKINRNGDEVSVDCPDKIAALYSSRNGSWRIPVLTGIITAPILREDGTVLVQPGYDRKTGLFLFSDGEGDWPAIPESPTHADVKEALRVLCDPFSQFPFVSEADLSVHIAGILTAIQRRLLPACPIFGYSAPAQRSGKSKLAESIAIVATGQPAPATVVSREREEMRKAITSALREGHSIINLDNIEIPLSSPDLAKAITQSEYQDRVLGETRMLRLPTNVLWTATGNNLTFRGDLSSRALLCRIDSGMERPEERTFKIPDLEKFLLQIRKQIVTAALTILRAYHVAGRPHQEVPAWGGFDKWSASIREPLIWAGLSDPCKTREAVVADDPEREESLVVLNALREAFGNDEFTVKEVIDRAEADRALKDAILGVAAPAGKDQIDPKRLGWWCRQNRDRTMNGSQLRRCGKASSKIAHWQVVSIGDGGGQRGHRGQFPATEGKSTPPTDYRVEDDAGQRGNDRCDPRVPEKDDEVPV